MINVLCVYTVKEGQEDAFRGILKDHAELLRARDLISDQPVQAFQDSRDKRIFIEVFQWKDQNSINRAHTAEGVGPIWDRMEAVVESIRALHPVPIAD
ncbi:MAG: hypothetical protein ABI743_08280 [bacterium]